MDRRWEIDVLRGLMLVLMTLTHLPTRLSEAVGQPLGHVSAAEGFVLLSAWMAGRISMQRAQRQGPEAMRRGFLRRAFTLYACHTALLLALFCAVALLLWLQPGHRALVYLAHGYVQAPPAAVVAGLALVYQPPLLDILPMYVLFLLASAPVMGHALRHGWGGMLIASVALWTLAQWGLGTVLHAQLVQWLGLPAPLQAGSPFSLPAWQLLWLLGLWLGARSVAQPAPPPLTFSRPVVLAALLLGVTFLALRHALGQTPFPEHEGLGLLLSKWTLGPLRLLNLLALGVLALHFGPALLARAPWLRVRALETLGRAALPVFCAHVVLVLAALATAGGEVWRHDWQTDLLLLAVAFAALWAVADGSQRFALWRREHVAVLPWLLRAVRAPR